nr:CDS-3 [Gordionus sp. m RMFG-2023]
MFSSVLSYNILSLFPYTFPITSSTLNIFMLSISLFTISISFFFKNMSLWSLIPLGSPIFLSPFLFLIELISLLIRPLTLSLRLSANITSGHILMHLCMSMFSMKPFMMLIPSVLLNLLELMVSFIQAYVYMSLISLYISESSNS